MYLIYIHNTTIFTTQRLFKLNDDSCLRASFWIKAGTAKWWTNGKSAARSYDSYFLKKWMHMFHDLLLWSLLFSGISLIFALFFYWHVLFIFNHKNIVFENHMKAVCFATHLYGQKKVFQNYCHCILKHITLLARCDSHFLLGESERPLPAKVSSFLATLPWETQTWKDHGSKQLEHWLLQGWLGEVQNSFWLHKIKFILQL